MGSKAALLCFLLAAASILVSATYEEAAAGNEKFRRFGYGNPPSQHEHNAPSMAPTPSPSYAPHHHHRPHHPRKPEHHHHHHQAPEEAPAPEHGGSSHDHVHPPKKSAYYRRHQHHHHAPAPSPGNYFLLDEHVVG